MLDDEGTDIAVLHNRQVFGAYRGPRLGTAYM